MELLVVYRPPRRWWRRATFRLAEVLESRGGVRVPIGFETDGTSVPWALRWLAAPTGPAMPAAVVHDYLLSQGWSWSRAAQQFRQELRLLGIPRWRVGLLYAAVRVWGWLRGYE